MYSHYTALSCNIASHNCTGRLSNYKVVSSALWPTLLTRDKAVKVIWFPVGMMTDIPADLGTSFYHSPPSNIGTFHHITVDILPCFLARDMFACTVTCVCLYQDIMYSCNVILADNVVGWHRTGHMTKVQRQSTGGQAHSWRWVIGSNTIHNEILLSNACILSFPNIMKFHNGQRVCVTQQSYTET